MRNREDIRPTTLAPIINSQCCYKSQRVLQVGVPFSKENAKFWPIFEFFVANLRTFDILFQAQIMRLCSKIDKYQECEQQVE